MIRLTDISFVYAGGDTPAIDKLSLEIHAGESVCVMGANGSGKTTLARLLAGLLEPTQGAVRIGHEENGPARDVGILFQNPDNQMVAVTVDKEIAFVLENYQVPPDEMDRRVTATLERFGIEHLRRRLTSELSGGEKQRVALASVMVSEPSILILDEPDSFLDQPGRIALEAELSKLRGIDPDMIQVHITQYPSTARQYDRLLVFADGRLVADASPESVFGDRELCGRSGLLLSISDFAGYSIPATLEECNGKTDPTVDHIELSNVAFTWPGADKPTLQSLDYTFNTGETTCIVGSSGSGKSTLGLMLCGLNAPTEGEIGYFDNDGESIASDLIAGRVSAVLQQPERQFFLPTCAEEVAFGPQNFNRPLDAEGVAQLLNMIGLDAEAFSERDPFRLSGGEKRRLAFVAVLSIMPQIIVLDEPTCGLDLEGVGRFVALARALHQRGKGLVVITHDGDLLHALADRILQLNGDGDGQTYMRDAFFADNNLASTVSPRTWTRG
ncbi:MAG: ATP-binding cassette domain-containing protein [candidate division Zixibacteria bacterium]|nr:ATP-binding cassette domain-containing protein [candidate division Zixibacteria bacterium]